MPANSHQAIQFFTLTDFPDDDEVFIRVWLADLITKAYQSRPTGLEAGRRANIFIGNAVDERNRHWRRGDCCAAHLALQRAIEG